MKKLVAAGVVALAAILTPAALALPGSVAVSSSATDATCNGVATVSVTIQTAAPPPEDAPLDLVIAIDESGSLSSQDYLREKQAAQAFVNALDFGNGARRVGVIAFSTQARTIINLAGTKASVMNAIGAMSQQPGQTNITDAIRDAHQMLATFGRPTAAKVLVLMTDGENNQETSLLGPMVSQFKALPGEIFALGFGTADVAQLNMIASDPDSTHVYLTPHPTQLSALALEIAEEIQAPAATDVFVDLRPAAPFVPVAGSATATAGSVLPTGAPGFAWLIPTLGTETQTVTFAVEHVGSANGTFPALATPLGGIFGNYRDGDGLVQAIVADSPEIVVSGCNTAPVADAGADVTAPLAGSSTALVSLDGTGSSDPDGDALAYEWSEGGTPLGTGATPTIPLDLGTHAITLTVTDPAGLSDTDVVVVHVVDPTPPVITPTLAGTLGDNGWYVSDVLVSWSVVDAESPVSTTGCSAAVVDADTSGASFACSATSSGGSSSETVSVKRDATAPVLAFSGNAGTYALTDTIAITCSATDATSGIATQTCPGASGAAIDFLGTNTLNASATDAAGNSAALSTTFQVVVDAAGICALVEEYVDQHGVAHALCTKLEHDSARAFENHVNAQRGKRLSGDEADLLIELARLL